MGQLVFFIFLCGASITLSLPSETNTRLGWLPLLINTGQTVNAIIEEGYPVQVHRVTTSDGYILGLHRIPFGRRNNMDTAVRPVVFLMHGLLSASSSYIALGAERSIAYSLAEAGCDVWIGNARGNRNSRQHVSLDPDDDVEKIQFFDFTWEEIGMIDVATMIDYVLQQTGREKLHYIGHSQGGTSFLVLMSMRPEYNEKIISSHLFAPAGYKETFPDPILRLAAQFTDQIWNLGLSVGLVEIFPPTFTINIPLPPFNFTDATSLSDYCGGDLKFKDICRSMNMDRLLQSIGIDLDTSWAGGAALKQIAHYGQNVRDKIFRRYDHGQERNIELYGTSVPPAYDLSLITSNVTLHYSLNDNLVSHQDVVAMTADMPNAVARQIARDSFTHLGFIVASDIKEMLNDFVIDAILRDEQVYINENLEESGEGGFEPEQQTDAASNVSLSYLMKMNLIMYSVYVLIKS